MTIASPNIDMSAATQGPKPIWESRLIIGYYNDPGLGTIAPFQPAQGGPGETYGNPDPPVSNPVLGVGGTGDMPHLPDPLNAPITADEWSDMRLISEPVGVSPFATGAIGGLIQQAFSTPDAVIGAAVLHASLDRFVGAMAGFVTETAGTMNLAASRSEFEPARAQIAMNVLRE